MPRVPQSVKSPPASAHLSHGRTLVVLVVALSALVALLVAVLRSEAFALHLIARAAGERTMALATGPDRCCDASFSSVKLDYRPLRIDIADFKLTRNDPLGERGGRVLLAEFPRLILRLNAGALWSNRAALESIGIAEGWIRIEARDGGKQGEWTIALENISLSVFSHVFPGARDLAGIASGEVELAGSLFAPDFVAVDLAINGASIRFKRFDIQGEVRLAGELARGDRGLAGIFKIDVVDAQVDVESAYRKPAGVPATISGKLAPAEDGQIEVRDLNYQAKKARVQIEL